MPKAPFLLLQLALALLLLSPKEATAQAPAGVKISLPSAILQGAGTATNLTGGWTNTTTSTNSQLLWTNNLANNVGGFYTNTVISTNIVVQYADFVAGPYGYTVIQDEFVNNTADNNSNVVYVVQRSVTHGNFDTANNISVTNVCTGTTLVVGNTQVDMRGYTFGRIASVLYFDNNNAHYVTNNMYYTGAPPTAGAGVGTR